MINNQATEAVQQISSDISDTFVANFGNTTLQLLIIFLLGFGLVWLIVVVKKLYLK